MELQSNQQPFNQLRHRVQSFSDKVISLFEQNEDNEHSPFILPLVEVETKLHEHYVNQQPINVTFEYFDPSAGIQLTTQTMYVVSTIQLDRTIELRPTTSHYSYFIEVEHILTLDA